MLEMDQIQALPNDMRTRYMLLEKLFDHAGFKYLLEWAKAQVADSQMRELNAKSWDEVVFFRGAKLAYNNFVEIERFSEAEFANIAEEAMKTKLAAIEDEFDTDD